VTVEIERGQIQIQGLESFGFSKSCPNFFHFLLFDFEKKKISFHFLNIPSLPKLSKTVLPIGNYIFPPLSGKYFLAF